MKRLLYLFLSIISIVALQSCDDRDDIRADIDSLNARLDKLEPLIAQYNTDIANYQGLLNGKILVVGYSELKEGENVYAYVVELSNGETITIYNGEPDETLPIMSIGEDGYWYYTQYDMTYPLLDENGEQVSASPEAGLTPQIRINDKGEWEYSFDGSTWIGNIGIADPELAQAGTSIFDDVKVEGDHIIFTWTSGETQLSKTVALYGGLSLTIEYGDTTPVVFGLGQTKEFDVTQSDDIVEAVIETTGWKVKLEETKLTITAPTVNNRGQEYEDQIAIKIFSEEGYCRVVTVPVKLLTTTIDENSATAWQNFLSGGDGNVLLDYSYAGYNRGETQPLDAYAWGYETINVKDYMAAHSLTSARTALEEILDSHRLIRKSNTGATNANARIVIYFPEGEYILQEKGSHEKFYPIYGGNFIIKGDGPDKTRLIMEDHIGTGESSTGALLTIGHSNSPRNINNSLSLAHITANASKGDFTVEVSSTSGISAGDWIQLRLRSNDDNLLQKELGPLYSNRNGWSITQQPGYETNGATEDGNGIRIMEFHQVKSVGNGKVTFFEPIMSDIDTSVKDFNGGWEIRQYKCYENVGVEDLAFVGGESLLTPYYHHGEGKDQSLAWMYDYAYKPLLFNRMVNSWVRNVTFESVSEAVTFDQSANCSAYNIRIEGKRGHSAVRAQESSRVFIGKVRDESSDEIAHGQYHGCGVSKPSIGTVVWNCTWGIEACFESHATQPRATLFDMCSGGLVYYHAGGAASEAPNHLRDLTLWNLNVTGTTDEKGRNFSTDFHWWLPNDTWWKIYPPIIVGTHGASVSFTDEAGQLTYEESTGVKVSPESLYEAQLEKRLGYVPAWLNAIK